MEASRVLPGDALLNITGASIGRACVVPGELCPANVNQHVSIIRCAADLDPAFLSYYMATPTFQRHIMQTQAGATRQALTQALIQDFAIPLPSLAEQKSIVAILNEQMAAVERAQVAAKARLEAAKALPAAYLRTVFESRGTARWPLKRIGDVARLQSGYAFKSEWFASEGVRLLRNTNVFQGYTSWEESVYLPPGRRPDFQAYELSVGDVVLSLDRPVVANGLKVARLTDGDVPSLLLQRVGRFRLSDQIDSGYLYGFLNSRPFIAAITIHSQSLGVPHVSPGQVEDVKIPMPPLSEQRRIAGNLSEQAKEAGHMITTLEAQVDDINALPAALLRRAFSGGL